MKSNHPQTNHRNTGRPSQQDGPKPHQENGGKQMPQADEGMNGPVSGKDQVERLRRDDPDNIVPETEIRKDFATEAGPPPAMKAADPDERNPAPAEANNVDTFDSNDLDEEKTAFRNIHGKSTQEQGKQRNNPDSIDDTGL